MESLSGRGLGVRRSVVVGPESPHPDAAVVGGREDVGVVGGDGVDGRVVRLHLPDQVAGLGRPELDGASPAPGHDNVAPGQIRQTTDPIFMCIIQRFDQLLILQIPFLDAGISGS